MSKITNSVMVKNDLVVQGNAKFAGATIHNTGQVDVGGELYVDGKIHMLEDVVDLQERYRFIEDSMSLTTAETQITANYNKWSLSGSHLMIVGTLACGHQNMVFPANDNIFTINNMPTWLMNKIYPIKIGDNLISVSKIQAKGNGGYSEYPVYLKKSSGVLYIYVSSETTIPNWANARISFDLIIDLD